RHCELPQAAARGCGDRTKSAGPWHNYGASSRVGADLAALLQQSFRDRPAAGSAPVMGWLRKHPVAAFLPLQALLCFWNLGLLSPWMDEAETLMVARRPVREILRFVSEGVHPPFFFLLVHAWQRLPLGLDWAVQARALSVVFALAATVAVDRLWASRLADGGPVYALCAGHGNAGDGQSGVAAQAPLPRRHGHR